MWKIRDIVFSLTILNVIHLGVVAGKVDICLSTCRCVKESVFVKIHCDFSDNKEYVLDNKLKLPPFGNALNITLGENSKLTITNGFFKGENRINSLNVQGIKEDFKRTESLCIIRKHALEGIWGNLPEISFKNLKTVVLSEEALNGPQELTLIAENVFHLTAKKEVFGTTSCYCSFNDIADLILEEGVLSTKSFNLTKLRIFINRSWIKTLYPMKGRKLTELKIENSEIETVMSSAFDIFELSSLILDNVTIQSIESGIFREGTFLESMAVINCKINKIASKAIHDVGITKFTFERNIVNSIEDDSLELVSSRVSIAHNKINFLGSGWLKTIHWESVNVENNTFGSFDTMILENPATSDNVQCTIHHNSFTKVQLNAFKSISDKCRYTELLFKQNCACNFHKWLEKIFASSKLDHLESESFCSLEPSDMLFRCLKAETVKFEQYKDEICSKKKSKLKCDYVRVQKIDANFIDAKVLSDDFDWREYLNYIIIGAVCLALIPCICITVLLTRKSRAIASDHFPHATLNYQTDLLQLSQSEGPPSYEASIRPSKQFSNHDRDIIKRTLETMKLKQPGDKYELVYTNTKRLLHEQLNEYEKVRIIGDVVQTIGECENSGEDFVAFTDILYKHLAPDTTTTARNTTVQRPQNIPDGLYSIPSQNVRNPAKANSEHIYAEPTVLMQQQTMVPLLLTNNYSNPLDSNTNSNVYSEPVLHGDTPEHNAGSTTFKPGVATPYAISAAIDQPTNSDSFMRPAQAGPSGALSRINRSPRTNRKIPEYTVPSTSQKTPKRVTQDNIEDWSDESMENSTSSNHSGGSNATVKIDEIVTADATHI